MLDFTASAAHLGALEDRFDALQLELKTVTEELKAARVQHNRIVNDASPIAVLPFDILSTIFTICQREQPRKISFELIALQTCLQWRRTALETPLLWSMITIDCTINRRKRRSVYTKVQQLETYLTRSRTAVFQLSLSLRGCDSIQDFLDVLLPHIHRCSHLDIAGDASSCIMEPISKSLALIEVPALRCFSLWADEVVHSLADSGRLKQPSIFKGASSCLTSVRLSGRAMKLVTPPMHLVHTMHLDFSSFHPIPHTQFVDLLDCSPLLENLSLSEIQVVHLPSSHPPIRARASLKSLRVYGTRYKPTCNILVALTLDQLEECIFREVGDISGISFPEVQYLAMHACFGDLENSDTLQTSFPKVKAIRSDTLTQVMHALSGTFSDLRVLEVLYVPARQADVFMSAVETRTAPNLTRIGLNKKSRTSLSPLRMQALRRLITVDNYDTIEAWPTGLEDQDDDSFWGTEQGTGRD